MKHTVTAGFIGLSLAMSGTAYADIVFDPTNHAQAVQQVANQLEQLQRLQDQLDEAKALYDSMNQITGVSDLASLLQSDAIQQALPTEFGDIHSSLSGLADELASEYSHYQPTPNAANDFYVQELARQQQETFGDMSVGQHVYETASQRIEGLSELRDAIGTATTQKEILDLQARIAAESALMENDQIRMQSLAMVQSARDRVDMHRAEERHREFIEEIRQAIPR